MKNDIALGGAWWGVVKALVYTCFLFGFRVYASFLKVIVLNLIIDLRVKLNCNRIFYFDLLCVYLYRKFYKITGM